MTTINLSDKLKLPHKAFEFKEGSVIQTSHGPMLVADAGPPVILRRLDMTDPSTCPRAPFPSVTPVEECELCGAMPHEECPFKDLSAELTTAPAIGAAKGGDDSGEDGVCESCQ